MQDLTLSLRDMDDEMNSPTPSDGSPGFWSSFRTDEASFPGGQFNFWATAETILAIWGFWYVALRWETLWPLYSSLAIAPLLFLRSDASVKQGVDWFENGFFPPRWPDAPDECAEAKARRARRWLWIGAAIGICVAIGVCYPAGKYFLAGHEGQMGFFDREGQVAFLLGLVFSFFVCTVAAAAAMAVTGALAGAGAVAGALAVERGEVVEGVLAAAAAVAGAGAGAATTAAAMAVAGAVEGVILGVVEGAFFALGFALAVWLNALFARILATFRHLEDGYRAMPANIRRLAFFIAPFHPPELLPGLPEGHECSIGGFITKVKDEIASPEWTDNIFGFFWFLILPIWFAPGWAYRIILKSTLWLWWILLFIGGAPNVAGGVAGLKADYKKKVVRFSLGFAYIYIVVFLLGNVFKSFVLNQLSDTPLIPVLAVLFLIDWRSIPFLPVLGALSSVLNIGAWLWADSIVNDSMVPGREDRVARGLAWLPHLNQLKAAIGFLTIALLMLYFALLENAKLGLWPLSDWLFTGLSWLYGKYAAALH